MKLIDQYKVLKKDYKEYIILLKRGTFYATYQDDAYIINHLFMYQITDEKVGFPSGSLDKVLNKLEECCINVYVDDTDVLVKEYENNNYQTVLYQAKKNYFNELNAKVLLEEIEFLLKSNPENISKIKSFISEL